ncbi:hypothetical protein ACS5PU_08250 [Pedobacter sp. GSP4]|uniref:hypothetical protein n=1 Tax=Pedobacter sp. GSP4 TaxID=3453716 RepID=UPI003EE8BFE0
MKTTIITHFALDKLGLSQADVDFLDVKLEEDNLIFVDYNKVLKLKTPLTSQMKASLDSFLDTFFHSALFKRSNESKMLLKGLHECNATRLGYSTKKPHGNSVGSVLQDLIKENTESVVNSLKTGQFSYNTLYFGIPQIGPDRISDIVVSIIKPQLIMYTQEQCAKYGIPTTLVKVSSIFDSSKASWVKGKYELPVFNGKPIIFIPKSISSTDSNLISTYNRFLRYGFRNFVKHNTEYAFLVDAEDKGKGVRKKDYEAYLKENGISPKQEAIKWIASDDMSILNFETELMSILEEISTQEIIRAINP